MLIDILDFHLNKQYHPGTTNINMKIQISIFTRHVTVPTLLIMYTFDTTQAALIRGLKLLQVRISVTKLIPTKIKLLKAYSVDLYTCTLDILRFSCWFASKT